MSYSCLISFKKMQPTEMLGFFRQLKEHISANLPEIAKDNRSYCPYIRRKELADVSGTMERDEWSALSDSERKDLFPRDFRNVHLDEREEGREWAMNSVFKYCVFYDEQRELLGMFGVPDAAHELFDGTVYFQNSCDQNYPREDWAGIAAFEEIYDKWQQVTPEQLHAHWVAEHNPHLKPGEKPRTMYDEYAYDLKDMTDDEVERFWQDRFDYMRKSCAYDEIWGHYAAELYDSANRLYFSLYSRDDYETLTRFVMHCHDAHVAHCDQYQRQDFETMCGQHPEKFQQWLRWFKDKPFDYMEQMQLVLDRSPGFLQRNPQYQDMYDKFILEHQGDSSSVPDELLYDDTVK